MRPGRWEHIEQVYQAARELDARHRPVFLDEACGRDEELRREVESLLSHEADASGFLETPALVAAADVALDESHAPPLGEPLRADERPHSHAAAPARPERPAPHPFVWFVWSAAAVTLAIFVSAALVMTAPEPAFGWRAAERNGIWSVESVAPAGPAAGLLRRGDRLVSLNGDPNVSRAGPNPHRRALSIGDTYELVVLRDAEQHEHRLTVASGPTNIRSRLLWFLMPLVWCAVGLFVGFARPGHAAARLACAASLATGLLFLHATFVRTGPLWAPMHVVLGYHFFLLFPTGVRPRGNWTVALYAMYGSGGMAVLIQQARQAFRALYGPVATTQLVATYPLVFRAPDYLGLAAYCAALAGMLAVIPWNYRKLEDEDLRRRVRWVVLGSAVAVAGQLWWAAIAVLDLVAGPSSIRRFDMSAAAIAIPITVAYAVVKHRVFDVRIVIRRGVQYLLARRALQAAVAVPVAALAVSVLTDRDRTIAELLGGHTGYLYWIAAASAGLTFRRPVGLWLDRRFFREEYDREQLLFGLVDDLVTVESAADLSPLVSARLDAALHPKVLYFWYEEGRTLALEYSSDQIIRPLEFPTGGRLLTRLEQHPHVVDVSPAFESHLTAHETAWLADLGATLLVPIAGSHERLTGIWMLGERKSETPFSGTDRRLLQAVARQTAVVRENLRLRAQVIQDERVRRDVFAHLDRASFNLLKECPECGRCFDSTAERCDRDGQPLTTSLPVERTIEHKYRLEQLIGRGGMGAVYETHDLRLRRTVAVKIMMGRAFGQHTALRRFEREARAAASLNHPSIVSIFDYGRLEGEGAYLVMERIHGLTLRARLDRDGALTPPEAAGWFEPLLHGLAAAHAQGIVHRDLKPANIIGQEGGSGLLTVKILDFGLAKLRPMDAAPSGSLTAGGFVVGTIGYMSPEQIRGRDVDHRSDIFAAGVMLAEALTGRRPFAAESDAGLFQAAPYDTYRLPCSSPESRILNDLVQRCLAQDPRHRPDSAAALRRDLIPALRACPLLDLPGGTTASPPSGR